MHQNDNGSWRRIGKATPPPATCIDCGMDTTPRLRGRPKPGCWEWYMVHDTVWQEAGMPPEKWKFEAFPPPDSNVYACIGCLERRLGRKLTSSDFLDCRVNQVNELDTPRLRDRKRMKNRSRDIADIN